MISRPVRWPRVVRASPRLFLVLAVTALLWIFLPEVLALHAATRFLVAWNVGALLYVGLAAVMMIRSSASNMKRRAQLQDDGQWVLLLLLVVAIVACLLAIGGQLAVVKDLHGALKVAHIALAGVTVVSSWAFIQVMFCLHYAHDFYAALALGRPAGLVFPDAEPPEYGDFFYFAAVIGTSGQTADVAFATKAMRRVGTLHCILSYLFNTTVLALLINMGASLF